MSDNKYNPSPERIQIVQPPVPAPIAALAIVLQPGLQVSVDFRGPLNLVLLEGMLAEARRQILEQVNKAQKGPQIEIAPAGLEVK
jgi:hypothetical protein